MRRVSYEPKYVGKKKEEKSDLDFHLDEYEPDIEIDMSLLDAEKELSYYENQQQERENDSTWKKEQRRSDYASEEAHSEEDAQEEEIDNHNKNSSSKEDCAIYEDYRASEEEIRHIEQRIVPQQSAQQTNINVSQIPLGIIAIFLAIVFAPIGIILGIIAVSTQPKYKKLGWIAIVIGIVNIVQFFARIIN